VVTDMMFLGFRSSREIQERGGAMCRKKTR